ncbi:hypothetical protein LINGRAHAP2_LOCUS18118, partial [Linum grandiflorum]
MLKDELKENNFDQNYLCTSCGRRYTIYDVRHLISQEDEFFHCEHCNGVVVEESDKLNVADGDAN